MRGWISAASRGASDRADAARPRNPSGSAARRTALGAEQQPPATGQWRPALTQDGSWTLHHPTHGEGCHNRAGAWLEAWERYALPCRLRERAQEPGRQRLRLLDVGTGMGTNLAAALAALEGSGVRLEALGLECDSEVFRATLRLFEREAPGPGAHWQALVLDAFRALLSELESAQVEFEPRGFHVLGPVDLPQGGSLCVLLGDGRRSLPAWDPAWRCDAVFLDPFSRNSDATLWEASFLNAVAQRMDPGSWLSTYSAAYGVREALAQAGLIVGQGRRLGAKAEGTLATPDGTPEALPERIKRRLRRAGIDAVWLA